MICANWRNNVTLSLFLISAIDALQLTKQAVDQPTISRRDDGELQRILLDQDEVDERGSYCLDGSQPGIYFEPADTKADPSAATKWVLAFPGGGWCKNEEECIKRSKFPMAARPSISNSYAIFGNSQVRGSDPSESPFSNYNHAVLWYCDGGIFGGDRDEPLSAPDPADKTKNVTLYFRGRRILEHMLDTLQKPEFGLSTATEVLLSGGSTGGLATYMHADFVGARLPKSVTKFKAVPAAGWFGSLPAWMKHGTAQYLEEMQNVFELHGLDGAGPKWCYKSLPDKDRWQCTLADKAYRYSQTPMFVLQALDTFLAVQNETSTSLSLRNFVCAGQHLSEDRCTQDDTSRLSAVLDGFVSTLNSTQKFSRPGEGGFLSSCNEHSIYENPAFFKFTDGGVTMAEAVYHWWNADSSEKADWHLPCKINDKPPYQCASCEL